MKPTPEGIDAICDLVDELCGIYLDSSKDYLIEGRLAKLVADSGSKDYVDFAQKTRTNAALRTEVVDAITTNETLWFRDSTPFDALRFKIYPELIDAKRTSVAPKRFRVWSAACSTGQEAYSLIMAFSDIVPDFASWDFQVFGTDISPSAIEQAKRGEYNELEADRGLSPQHRAMFFTKTATGWRANDELRRRCTFQVGNLLRPFNDVGTFDVIFCRNVSIYFTPEDRRSMFLRLGERLNRGGWLFTGSGESLLDLGPNWSPKQHCRAVCYQPNGCNGVATLAT